MIAKRLPIVSLFFVFSAAIGFQPLPQAQRKQLDVWYAAKTGNLTALQNIPNLAALVNSADPQNGVSPLAWAALAENKTYSQNYLPIVQLLTQLGANLNFTDKDGQTILHYAVRGGDIKILEYLLTHGAKNLINTETREKGRTPLAEVLRASKNAVIHVKIENQDFAHEQELENALQSAFKELIDKESNKLSTDQMIQIINLLRAYGANPNPTDLTGRSLDYYINNVELVSEPERENLLKAIGAPQALRTIHYGEKNLTDAINILEKLKNSLEQFGLKPKINNAIWILQIAQKSPIKYSILRIAMALISKIKEEAKNKIPDQFATIEPLLDKIRTILRDTLLILSKKAVGPDAPTATAPTGVAPQQAQPASTATPARSVPRVIPSEQPVPAHTPSSAQPTVRTLRNAIIKSNNPIDIASTSMTRIEYKGTHSIHQPLREGDLIELGYYDPNQKLIAIGKIKITRDGMNLEFPGRQPIVLAGRKYDQFDVEIRENNTLQILPV